MTWPPSLAVVAGVVGMLIMLSRLPGLVAPARYREGVIRFPRSVLWGRVLMVVVAVLAGFNLYRAASDDWAWARPVVVIGVPVAYWLVIQFGESFLAVRAAAALGLFLAKVMVTAADRSEHPLRLVVTVFAYLWVVVAIWMAIAPHHFRDIAKYAMASDARCRAICAAGVAVGAVLVVLGAFVY